MSASGYRSSLSMVAGMRKPRNAGRHVRRLLSPRAYAARMTTARAFRRLRLPETHAPCTIGTPIARPSQPMSRPRVKGAGARGLRTRIRLHVAYAHACSRARRRPYSPQRPLGYSFTACQTSLKPSPFLSPFAASFAKK